MSKTKSGKTPEAMSNIDIYYTKSSGHTNFSADGAFGGFNPNGQLAISFYSELMKLPDMIRYEVTEEGRLGDEMERFPNEKTLAREINTTIYMSLDTAKRVHDWLGNKIELIESQSPESDE